MKNPNLLVAVGIVFLVVGCEKRVPVVREDVESVTFSISPMVDQRDENETKTSVQDDNVTIVWADKDTVGIYPDTGSQVYFALSSEAGATSVSFDGGGWALKPSSTYYSYYPFIGNMYLKRNMIPVSYVGQKQVGTTRSDHIGPFYFMYTPGSSSSTGSVNFSYKHLGSLLEIRCILPAGTYTKLAVTAPSEAFTTEGYYDLTSAEPVIVPTKHSNQMVIDLDKVTVTANQQFYVYLMVAPVDLQGVEITVSALNSSKAEFQCKKTPSKVYAKNTINGLGCTSWTQVPQSMGLIVEDWGDGGNIGGDAD
ncbi:MAG: fimbrillin family protein [Bacteroidales bacterium]|nr:fimbrillin family protein [Bacteroidales bacterium]